MWEVPATAELMSLLIDSEKGTVAHTGQTPRVPKTF